jgi:transposase-like protein
MAQPQRRFTQEFRDEAVRLVETSGARGARWPRISGLGSPRFGTGSTAAAIGSR